MSAEATDMQAGEVSAPGIRISIVVVGDRARKEYRDLEPLMDSIRQHGLLQPVGILRGNQLLFGGRRVEACRRLGWDSIPMTDQAGAPATWERKRGAKYGSFPVHHIHMIVAGCPHASKAAKRQLTKVKQGRDGLARNGPDYEPKVTYRTWRQA
jgi:hypothetical protein